MTDSNRKFLIFSLGGSRYALDLALVTEVSDPPQMSPIPLSPVFYTGAMNFHGAIVAVINLAQFLGLPESSTPDKVIILNQEAVSLAFLVDTVVRIVPEDEILFGNPPDNCFAVSTCHLADGDAIQLDLDSLVNSAEMDFKKTFKY